MRNNPRQCPCQASCHRPTAPLGCLVSGPLTSGAQASPQPAASVDLVQNKESTVAQPGFSSRYLVGHNEREPEPQGRDYRAALPTTAARNKALAIASPLPGTSVNTSQAYIPIDCRGIWAKKPSRTLNGRSSCSCWSAWCRWAAVFTGALVYRKMK